VVYLIDSQNAGNQQNKNFIEEVARQRNRKVFFVINKADQLNADENRIPRATAAPQRISCAASKRHRKSRDILPLQPVRDERRPPHQGRISLEDLDNNRKIKIPFAMLRPS